MRLAIQRPRYPLRFGENMTPSANAIEYGSVRTIDLRFEEAVACTTMPITGELSSV